GVQHLAALDLDQQQRLSAGRRTAKAYRRTGGARDNEGAGSGQTGRIHQESRSGGHSSLGITRVPQARAFPPSSAWHSETQNRSGACGHLMPAISRLSVSIISAGVPAAATSPTPEPTSKPGNAASDRVGTSGSEATRLRLAVARASSLPSWSSGSSELMAPMNMSMRPATKSGRTAVAPRNGT